MSIIYHSYQRAGVNKNSWTLSYQYQARRISLLFERDSSVALLLLNDGKIERRCFLSPHFPPWMTEGLRLRSLKSIIYGHITDIIEIKKDRKLCPVLILKYWAGVDCLVRSHKTAISHFASVFSTHRKSASASAPSRSNHSGRFSSYPFYNKKDPSRSLKSTGQGWIRTTVHSREQIYSLSPLATRPPTLI